MASTVTAWSSDFLLVYQSIVQANSPAAAAKQVGNPLAARTGEVSQLSVARPVT